MFRQSRQCISPTFHYWASQLLGHSMRLGQSLVGRRQFRPMSVEESAETWLGGRIQVEYSNQVFHTNHIAAN